MSSLSYQGSKTGSVLDLHYFDNDGPVFVRLPRAGREHMCCRQLSDDEVSLILLNAAEKELFKLMDQVTDRTGGCTVPFFEGDRGQFRKLDITMADIEASGLTIPTDVLGIAARSGFFDPTTGSLPR